MAINRPDDAYEREAERVAEDVTATPRSVPSRTQRESSRLVSVLPANAVPDPGGSGRPLEPRLREEMEQRFGYDFSGVQVHTGPAAAQSADNLNARAYTTGSHIVFAGGGLPAESREGRRLIAHELTHVVQQSNAGSASEVPGMPAIPAISLRQSSHGSIQRQTDFGLATGANIDNYAAKVYAFIADKANQSKSFEDLARYAVSVCNDELRAAGVPVVPVVFKPIPTVAHFQPFFWTMTVNTDNFTGKSGILTVGQLTKTQMSDLVQSIYHEARHAEQSFKVARLLAGMKKSAREIWLETPVERTVAEEAKAHPLTATGVVDEYVTLFLEDATYRFLGDTEDQLSKRRQAMKESIEEDNREFAQVQDWYLEKPLNDLIYDLDLQIRKPLKVISEEVKKRKAGSWDSTKVQAALDTVRTSIIPKFDTELRRVSAQKDRAKMVEHLTSIRKSLAEMLDFAQRQQSSSTPILELDLLAGDTRMVEAELAVTYELLLEEADSYTQGYRVQAAMDARKRRKK